MAETLKQIKKRNSKDVAQFQETCKHRKLIVLETSAAAGGMHSPLRDTSVWKTISEHKTNPKNEYELEGYESILVKCKDCGTPLICIDHHGLSVYIQPHYVSKGIVLPKGPFDKESP